MTDEQIKNKLHRNVRIERRVTKRILELINLAEDRLLYVRDGYPTLHKWLVGEFKYSDPAANRRTAAARLLRDVPDVTEKMESGEINLTTLLQADRAIRVQEKVSDIPLTASEKAEVVAQVENKSSREAEQALVEFLPEIAGHIQTDRITVVTAEVSRLSINVSNKTLENIERAREVLSHALGGASLDDLLARITEDWLNRHDPLRKKPSNRTSAAVKRRVEQQVDQAKEKVAHAGSPALTKPNISADRRAAYQRAHGRCEFRDSKSGRACGSRYNVQIDHIIPRADGGRDELANFRCLCGRHNRLEAERVLGARNSRSWQLPREVKDRMAQFELDVRHRLIEMDREFGPRQGCH